MSKKLKDVNTIERVLSYIYKSCKQKISYEDYKELQKRYFHENLYVTKQEFYEAITNGNCYLINKNDMILGGRNSDNPTLLLNVNNFDKKLKYKLLKKKVRKPNKCFR